MSGDSFFSFTNWTDMDHRVGGEGLGGQLDGYDHNSQTVNPAVTLAQSLNPHYQTQSTHSHMNVPSRSANALGISETQTSADDVKAAMTR